MVAALQDQAELQVVELPRLVGATGGAGPSRWWLSRCTWCDLLPPGRAGQAVQQHLAGPVVVAALKYQAELQVAEPPRPVGATGGAGLHQAPPAVPACAAGGR